MSLSYAQAQQVLSFEPANPTEGQPIEVSFPHRLVATSNCLTMARRSSSGT